MSGYTQEEKAKKLQEILGRAAKRNKVTDLFKSDKVENEAKFKEYNDEDHDELLHKLKKTEERYWAKKRDDAKKKVTKTKDAQKKKYKLNVPDGTKPWYHNVKYRDLENIDWSLESTKTTYLFVFNIAAMILLMFVLFGIMLITFIVWMLDDEMDVLHEMPEVDTSLFKHNISEILTFIPFCFMAITIAINLTLILTESLDEVWFYMKNNMQGIKILNTILALYIAMMVYLCVSMHYQEDQIIEIRHIIANSFGLV